MGTPPLRLRVLGGFHVAVGDRTVPESAWRLRKAKSLIKLLALAPERRLHRERVGELLWPDRDPAPLANNLHQAIFVARRALDPRGRAPRCLALQEDMIGALRRRPGRDRRRASRRPPNGARGRHDRGLPRGARAYGGELLPEDRTRTGHGRRDALRELRLALVSSWPSALEAGDGRRRSGPCSARWSKTAARGAHRRLMRLYVAARTPAASARAVPPAEPDAASRVRGRARRRDTPPVSGDPHRTRRLGAAGWRAPRTGQGRAPRCRDAGRARGTTSRSS